MAGIFSFKCSSCEEIHEGSPSFSFSSPYQYDCLSEAEKAEAHLDSDFCYIDDDRFIRVCLEVPIIGVEEPFMWGVWVSLSQENFERYRDTYDAPVITDEYFSWFCNRLPFYPETLNLKALVHPRIEGIRPSLDLEPTDHPLSIDFKNSISISRAQEIAEYVMHKQA
jgi:hypothetical protein